MKHNSFRLHPFGRALCFALALLAPNGILATETPPAILWQRSFGGTSSDQCDSVVATRDGGFLLVGESRSGISGNKTSANYGGPDIWLVKVADDGTKLWDRSFGGSDWDGFTLDLVLTEDDGILIGGQSRSGVSGNKTSTGFGGDDYWLVRVDPLGNKVWDKSYGGTGDDYLSALASTGDGGFLLGGMSRSGASGNKTAPGYGDYDIWLVKVDALGNKLWDRTFGGSGREGGNFTPVSVVATGDDGFLIGVASASGVSGNKTSVGYGGFDFWLVKVDTDGTKMWERSFGGSNDDVLYDIAPTLDGGFMLGGASTSGAWLVKVDSNGNKRWDKSFGGNLESIAPAGNGGFLLGGWQSCNPDCGDSDYSLVKVDASGNQLWQQSYGGTAVDVLSTIVAGSNGGFLLAGLSDSGVSGNKTTPNLGGNDFWVIKLFGLPPCTNCPPRFIVQPTNQLVLPGTNVTLATAVASTSSVRYQWRFEGMDILGATNATYSFTNVSLTNGHGNFSVVVSNEFGTATSSNAFVFVRIRPGIVTQPVTQRVLERQSATFTCVATGAPPIFYRWSGTGIAPFTNTTGIFVFSNAVVSIPNGIRCHAFNAAANVQSVNASLIVLPDFDRDGMGDSWEAQYGFNTNNAADALLDFDQDGMSNRDEYTAATDPMDASALLKLTILHANGVRLQFTAQSNLTYSVQFRTSLVAATPWQTLSNVASASTTRTLDFLDLAPPAGGRFYRIRTPLESDR